MKDLIISIVIASAIVLAWHYNAARPTDEARTRAVLETHEQWQELAKKYPNEVTK